MNKKNWEIASLLPENLVNEKSDLAIITRQILYNRNISSIKAMEDFIFNHLDSADFDPVGNWLKLYNPFLFKDMEEAVNLIINTILNKEKIVIYGDYDADGVTAAVVLFDTLKILKAEVDIYLPDRVSEGYGLNKEAIDKIKQAGTKLIITVDNGIRNYKEVEYAKENNIDIIITDHHVFPEDEKEIPDCLIINSSDKRSSYPFSLLAGVGVAYKLASALVYKSKLNKDQKKTILEKNLDLVALGTIADLVPLLGENRILVNKGLEILNKNNRLGINALNRIISKSDKPKETWNISWQIAPRLNAASRIGHANSAFSLLTTKNEKEANSLASELNKRNIERQKITEDIIATVDSKIDKDNLPNLIIGLAEIDEFWNEGVIGLVAGRICEKYYRPTLIISRIVLEAEFDKKSDKMKATKTSFKGSGRSIEGFNLINAIEKAADYLDKYGGHPMACGFSIENEENYNKFKEVLERETKLIDASILIPKLKIDAKLKLSEINKDLVLELKRIAPFGQTNPEPKFISENVKLVDISFVGADKKHVKLFFAQEDNENEIINGIFFNAYQKCKDMKIGQHYDIAYYLDINDFNGLSEVQLKLIDIKDL